MKDEKEKTVDVLEDEPVEEESSKKTKKEKMSKQDAEIKVLKEENQKLFKEKEELNQKLLLNMADYQNYKKRLDDEQTRFYKYSTYSFSQEIIKTLDGLDFVLDKKIEDPTINAYVDGFRMIRNQLAQTLEKEGVTEIPSLGLEFDPKTMEAISMVNDPTKKDQEVVNVYLKGYMYKDRVLRHASVVINQVEETTNTNEE